MTELLYWCEDHAPMLLRGIGIWFGLIALGFFVLANQEEGQLDVFIEPLDDIDDTNPKENEQ